MKLTVDHAALVKGMLARGDKQHDIAAFFGVNGGRITEIKTGVKFADVPPAMKRELPLVSALLSGLAIYEARRALDRAQAGINAARVALDEFEARTDIPGGA